MSPQFLFGFVPILFVHFFSCPGLCIPEEIKYLILAQKKKKK